jgi:hypothetical protein
VGGDGVDMGADDWAVVRDEADGTRSPGRAGVVEKLPREPNEISCVPLDTSGCITRAADIGVEARDVQRHVT